MNKKNLSEADIRSKFITPALVSAGWDLKNQIREEVTFTKGRVIVRGNQVIRGERKRADYILFYKQNLPLAVIEAKDNNHSIGAGIQQALKYAEILDIPFIYSSNGDGFLEHDSVTTNDFIEKEIGLEEFPSPNDLWRRYTRGKSIDKKKEEILLQPYFFEKKGKIPRYYQQIAINRTIERIIKGQKRILLVMATGTGKTLVAFQIIWRLWKAKIKKRILFLADRNILVDQTIQNDFSPFEGVMKKITKRIADPSYEVYLALYQAITGKEERKNIYKEFSKDFFDLIVIDECHRGSVAEDSVWREILDYFCDAIQIGMTATPKETKYISNIHYFGEPIYTYSLKQGIGDGFIAPYKVIRVSIDKDILGWRPQKGQKDIYGFEIPDEMYTGREFDRLLVIEERTKLVAKRITEFLIHTDRYAKSIIFCEDIEHAERMRKHLINANPDLVKKNKKYVMKITGDDKEGKNELENFINPKKTHPVIATTSKLMSTGIDAQTCKLIVLDKTINSLTEFKQIIGRGTRINEEYDKYYFTIMDFRLATNLFADPQFDGEPISIYEIGDSEFIKDIIPFEEINREKKRSKRHKFYVNNVAITILAERVQYIDEDGKIITESLKDFSSRMILSKYSSLDEFINEWTSDKKKRIIVEELKVRGFFLEEIQEEIGKDFDVFDLICHIAYDKKPLTRSERARKVKETNYFSKYGQLAREVMDALIERYSDQGIYDIEEIGILKLKPFSNIGSVMEIVNAFGGKIGYLQAIKELKTIIYN